MTTESFRTDLFAGKVALVVSVTKDLTSRIQAGKVVGAIAEKVGGKGGGGRYRGQGRARHPPMGQLRFEGHAR